MHPLDAVKFLADSLSCYIFFNKQGELVLKNKNDINTGTVRTLPSVYKTSGTKKYFWDKLIDSVSVTVQTSKTGILKSITAITKEAQAQFTIPNHGYTAGNPLMIFGDTISEWENLLINQNLLVVVVDSNTIKLTSNGSYINSSGMITDYPTESLSTLFDDGITPLTWTKSISIYPGIKPRNEIQLQVLAPSNLSFTQTALDNYALSIAQNVFNFYGNRHFYYNIKARLNDDMLDWELLDLIYIAGEYYFILSSEIDEVETTATFELVSVNAYSYNYQQAQVVLSPANYAASISSASPTSIQDVVQGVSGGNVAFSAQLPLHLTGAALSINYSNNLINTNGALDTIQGIKITDTPQFARIGIGGIADLIYKIKNYGDEWIVGNQKIDGMLSIGGAADTNYKFKNYGDEWIVGNEKIDGMLSIGGAADTNYKFKNYGDEWIVGNQKIDGMQSIGGVADTNYKQKIYGDQKITGNISVDGNLYIGGVINEVNQVNLNVVDHTINLNKSGDNTTAIDGGIQMLGASDAVIGSIKFETTEWLSDLNINLASGKVYKINSTQVLSATALGTAVISSSLTSVGTLTTGVWNATIIDGTYINYNTSNLKVTSNTLNTIQDISTTSSPQFTNETLTGQLTCNIAIGTAPFVITSTTTLVTNLNADMADNFHFDQSLLTTASPTFVQVNATNISLTGYAGSSVYTSQTTGWRITNDGSADFQYLYANEMHVKSFIADLEQALAGEQIITKSVAKVFSDFVVPSIGYSGTLYIEAFAGFSGFVFQDGDNIRLRSISRISGGLSVYDCWGTVVHGNTYPAVGSAPAYQSFTFTRVSGGAIGGVTVITAGTLALDYGISGNGTYEVSTIDGLNGVNSPYARIQQFVSPTSQLLLGQFGNLNGAYGYSSKTYGIAVGDQTKTNLTVEATNGIQIRYGTTNLAQWDTNGKLILGKIASNTNRVELASSGINFIYNDVYNISNTVMSLDSSGIITIGQNLNSQARLVISSTGINFIYKNSSGTDFNTISINSSGVLSVTGYTQPSDVTTIIGQTTIQGGKIATNTISLSALNFIPVQTSNVVGSINASSEGITINGAKLTINSSTTFATGYDPSGKISSGGAAADINNNTTTISGGKITTGTITALGNVTAGTFSLGSGAFSVDASGKLTSTSASIANWSITTNNITQTFTSGNYQSVISLYGILTSLTAGLQVVSNLVTSGIVNQLIVTAGSYNDGGYMRTGFALWDCINSNWLMNVGYGNNGMVSTIAGWNFTKGFLNDSAQKIYISSDNTSIYIRPLTGLTKFVMVGQTYCGGTPTAPTVPIWTGHYGISAIDNSNNWLFRLDDAYTIFAGWNFDYQKFTIGTSSAGISLNTSITPFIANSGSGFEVWNASNPMLMIGVKNSAGTGLTSGFDWNYTTTNKLTVVGDVISSRFSTSANFSETGVINYSKLEGNQCSCWDFTAYSPKQYYSALNPYGIYITEQTSGWVFSANSAARSVMVCGYYVPKFLGITNSTAFNDSVGSLLTPGDFRFNTSGKFLVWNGAAWAQIN
jgi:hypothetical protein